MVRFTSISRQNSLKQQLDFPNKKGLKSWLDLLQFQDKNSLKQRLDFRDKKGLKLLLDVPQF